MSGRGDDRIAMYGDDELQRLTREEMLAELLKHDDIVPHDQVQRPSHYQQFGVEVIDIIRHVLGPEGFKAYCIGNELKYRLRAGDKGDAAQDMAKAMKYREFRERK